MEQADSSGRALGGRPGGGGAVGLSMEERRILWEIEQELTRAEPSLAVRLSTLGHARHHAVLYTRRARAAWTVAVIVVIFVLTYTLLMLRATPRPVSPHRPISTGHSTVTGRSTGMTATPSSPAKSLPATRLNGSDISR